jgi:hypothetical protein
MGNMQKPDIQSVLEKEGVELRRKGGNWWACCPLHEEKTPSFKVSAERQSFHCFGCGAHGDVISFIRESHNLSFQDALAYLGIEKGRLVKVDRKAERRRQLKRSYHAWLKRYYFQLCAQSCSLHTLRLQVAAHPTIPEDQAWKFAAAMGKTVEIDYLLDLLLEGSEEEKFQLFMEVDKNGI